MIARVSAVGTDIENGLREFYPGLSLPVEVNASTPLSALQICDEISAAIQ